MHINLPIIDTSVECQPQCNNKQTGQLTTVINTMLVIKLHCNYTASDILYSVVRCGFYLNTHYNKCTS